MLLSFRQENVRRYQQQLREQSHPTPVPQQPAFKLPESAGWARQASQTNDQTSQPMNFAEIQKQEQEQERRAREAAMSAHQLVRIRLAIEPRMARFPLFT